MVPLALRLVLSNRKTMLLSADSSQGGSVARTFSGIPGWEVRGITRNPTSTAARQLEKSGVTLIQADLDDVDSLIAAFQGANAIFGVTDFWQFAEKQSTLDIAHSKGITWNEASYLQEVQQGKNLIDAAAHIMKEGKLERMVYSSLSDAKKASKGKYTWVYHFDGKAKVVQYLEENSHESAEFQALFERTSYVQMGYYLDNWRKNPILFPKKVGRTAELYAYKSNLTDCRVLTAQLCFRILTTHTQLTDNLAQCPLSIHQMTLAFLLKHLSPKRLLVLPFLVFLRF